MKTASKLQAPDRESVAQVSPATCDACAGDCAEVCFNGALQRLADGSCRLVPESCAGCGACIPMCAFGKIRLAGGIARFVSGRLHQPMPRQE